MCNECGVFQGKRNEGKFLATWAPPLPSLHKHHTWLTELGLCFDFLSGLELPNTWLASLDAFFFLSLPSKVRFKPFSLGTEHYMIRKCLVERHDSERSKVQLHFCCLLLPSPLSLPSAGGLNQAKPSSPEFAQSGKDNFSKAVWFLLRAHGLQVFRGPGHSP